MSNRLMKRSTEATSSIMVFPSDTNDYGTILQSRLPYNLV